MIALTTYQDFNGSPGDLGRNGQSLEEGGLLRAQSRVPCLDEDLDRGNGPSFGRSFHLCVCGGGGVCVGVC